jgi:hypothetical protein
LFEGARQRHIPARMTVGNVAILLDPHRPITLVLTDEGLGGDQRLAGRQRILGGFFDRLPGRGMRGAHLIGQVG